MSVLELFCHIDDFCQRYSPTWEQMLLESGRKRRRRARSLWMSEVMTIVVHFHQQRYRDFKTYYTRYVQTHLRSEFPNLVSYNRFVEFLPAILVPLAAYLRSCYGRCTGISFIDSTPLAVCHNRRIQQHQTFDGVAARGKNSVDWFYGFKVHLLLNDRGELLACRLTPGNVDDRRPVPRLVNELWGKLFGDKGYLSQSLRDQLRQQGVELITRLKSNMKNQLMLLEDKILLRKRAVVEAVVDQLKNISQIEHTRHRSLTGLMVNLLAGLIAYCHQPKKPSLHIDRFASLEALIPN